MKNVNKIVLAFVFILGCSIVISCSDATEVEHLEVYENRTERTEAYLSQLRAYKQSNHKKVYGWMDNSEKTPTRRYQRYINLPDSLDGVIVEFPLNLESWELEEMSVMRDERGTKFYCPVSCDDFIALFNKDNDVAITSGAELVDFVTKSVATYLKEQASYDGIIFECRIETSDVQIAFIDAAMAFIDGNPNVAVFYEGQCLNISNTAFLNSVDLIFVPCTNTLSAFDLYSIFGLIAGSEGVEYSDKFVAIVDAPSLDEKKETQGRWGDDIAIDLASQWVAINHLEYSVIGLGVKYMIEDRTLKGEYFLETKKGVNNINPSF